MTPPAAGMPDDVSRLREVAGRVCADVFAVLDELTVSECADRYRILPKTSAESGRFDTDRIPYLRGIQDALSNPDIAEVVFAKGAQVAGTTVGENYILYVMVQDPSALLSVWPTKEKYQIWVGERLDPMIDDCDVLRSKFPRSNRRDEPGGGRRESGDSLARKVFSGGFLQCLTSKSTSLLKSIAAQRVILEEVDEFVPTAQGDVVELTRVRQRTYGSSRKLYMCSTPTLVPTPDGGSRVWKELSKSTWHEFWVPCPHCDEYQVLTWRDGEGDDYTAGNLYFVWEKDAEGYPIPGTARCVCQKCGTEIEERDKMGMLRRGEWRARFPGRAMVGFHISALYSPLCTWDDLVEAFARAVRGGPDEMMVFVNTWLGLPYQDRVSRVDVHFLASRREPYGEDVDVPNGVGVLVAGADVQSDRVEVFVWGYGKDEQAWLIAWEIVEGDPQKPSTWKKVAAVLERHWTHASGAKLRIAAMAVDAGYATEYVHRFCDGHPQAFAVVGRSGPGKPMLVPPDVSRTKWRAKGRKKKAAKRPTHVVGTDTLKNDLLRTRLQITKEGPHFIHFPNWLDPVFFDQLTAEHLTVVYRDRRPVRVWTPIEGRANEALDGWVYARAALRKLELETPNLLAQLEPWAQMLTNWKPNAKPATPKGPRGRRVISKGVRPQEG